MRQIQEYICSKPAVLKQAIVHRTAALKSEQEGIETEAEHLQKQLTELTMEQQWIITQARKGTITKDDMALQLATLQLQEVELRKDLDERRPHLTIKLRTK